MPFWKRGLARLEEPSFPANFPAPTREEDVAGYLIGVIFQAQLNGRFPRCGGMTLDSAGLPGHGVVIHFDERDEEDDAFCITVSRERIPPGRETPAPPPPS